LSAQVRKIVRLPTEAEWEYACRAGSKGRFCDGDDYGCLDTFAWYYDPNIAGTHPVGQKRPNPWGLYDMHGNVCEWCEDWYDARYYEDSILTDPRGPYSGTERILRGGAWGYEPAYCRTSRRNSSAPLHHSGSYGFRCVLEA
jgi:formylglycine-generating enzyme required for sulfatase activity